MRAFAAFLVLGSTCAQPLPKTKIDALCPSVNSAEWIAPGRVAIDCHRNPSLSYYIVMEAASGKELSRTPGVRFTPSPDGKRLAHIGPLVHFAPPGAKSYTMVVDGKVIYPSGPSPDYRDRDIHEFLDFQWSPDSRRIALIDRLFDWKADAPGSTTGDELNVRYVLVVLSDRRIDLRQGLPATTPIPEIQWLTPTRLRLTQPTTSSEIDVPLR